MKKILILLMVGITFLGCEAVKDAANHDPLSANFFIETAEHYGTYYYSTTGDKMGIAHASGEDEAWIKMGHFMDDVDYVRLQMLPNTDDTIYEGTFIYNEKYNAGLDYVIETEGVIMIENVVNVPKGGIIGTVELRYVQTEPDGGENRRVETFTVYNDSYN